MGVSNSPQPTMDRHKRANSTLSQQSNIVISRWHPIGRGAAATYGGYRDLPYLKTLFRAKGYPNEKIQEFLQRTGRHVNRISVGGMRRNIACARRLTLEWVKVIITVSTGITVKRFRISHTGSDGVLGHFLIVGTLLFFFFTRQAYGLVVVHR